MIIFALVGVTDYFIGNRFGYGEKFKEGLSSIIPLIISMLGILTLIPLISNLIKPFVFLLGNITKSDPGIFINSILALDMGGYALSKLLSNSVEECLFSGILVGAMLGTTIIFTIPIAFSILSESDKIIFSKGILAGILTIPIGCFVGGIIAKFSLKLILLNLFPITLISVILAISLLYYPEKTIKSFKNLENILKFIGAIGLMIFIIEFLGEYQILNTQESNFNNIKTIFKITITLAGALPFFHFINIHFQKYLKKLGLCLDINDSGVTGLLASLANNIPTFKILKDMDYNGKMINSAFAASGAFVFGGQLAFTLSVEPTMIIPFILGKLSAGISAIYLIKYFIKKEKEKKKHELQKNKCY
ncbi:ethanolamine utilization protein EutH [Cetobacterium sp. SF1]|uniref:ethanolamine utilization protein EutH n=1 Tax=Cetobacterium sp. SF1 TaxID=3417654 RepID=UPI003CED640E